jgi:hypothetical protein
MQIVARRVDGQGRLWFAQRTTGLEVVTPSEHATWSLHASRPRVDLFVAEALRDGKRICAYDEPIVGESEEIPPRFAPTLDRLVGHHLAWEWTSQPWSPSAIRSEQDAIAWFLASPSVLLVMGEVTFEKRQHLTTPSTGRRRTSSLPPVGAYAASSLREFACSWHPLRA